MEKTSQRREQILLLLFEAFVNLLLLLGNAALYLFSPEKGREAFVAAVLTALLLTLCGLRLRWTRALRVSQAPPRKACLRLRHGLTALHDLLVVGMALFSFTLCVSEALFFPVLTDALLLALNGGDLLFRCLR